jgi:uncharacterized protein (DUF362 family)
MVERKIKGMKNQFITRLLTNKKWLSFWIVGFLAFIWIVLRSGTNPKRLAYPCQQSAFPLASAWFIAVIGIFGGGLLLNRLLKGSFVLLLIVGTSWIFTSSSRSALNEPKGGYPVWKSTNPLSKVFIFENIPPTTGSLAAGNATVPNAHLSDPGIDSLFAIMESNGTKFYKTTQNPSGIVGANDIVIIKANFQWRGRLSTNTDRIKGVIWKVLNHPEGFTGEVIVADNGSEQIQPAIYFCGITDFANNSDDTNQSILDVISVFKAKNFPVDYFIWDNLNANIVTEYSANNLNNGYVYNPTTKVNYPKFRSPRGSYISLKHGIWNTTTSQYDLSRLTIINMPVLKAHGLGGATVAVKNWVGVMNQIHADTWYGGYNQFHDNYIFESYALPSRVMNEIWPKLNIVDATYTATRSNFEPGSPTTKTNTVLASTDPVAVSWYSAKYILDPIAQYDKVNPDYTSGGDDHYGTALNYWYNYFINNTTRVVTKDPLKMSVYGNRDITTSIVDSTNPLSMAVYPNPSTDGRFNVKFDDSFVPDMLYLVNSSGVLIGSYRVTGREVELDLGGYSGGSYHLYYLKGAIRQGTTLINLR